MAGATRARPPKADDMPNVAPYQGPTGERLDRESVFFTPTRPTATDPVDDEPGTDDDDAPSRHRYDRCRRTGRCESDRPDGARAPPAG